MGVVFLATDTTLDRRVAIKVVHPELAAHPSIVRRFLAEARTIARLRHPSIVTVHAAGTAQGLLYYVMDEVEGESLRQRLSRDGKLPIDEVARIVADLAAALDAAGRAGVVHRDVKPENVLIESGSGRALLADFGIARAMVVDGASSTGQGVAVGTPSYMSPEQAAGEEVDSRSDLYGLGVVAYEMLAGHPPFQGTNRVVVSKHIAERPAPIERVRPDCPRPLAGAVMKALEKQPGERWQTGEELRQAVVGERALPREAGRPAHRRRGRRRGRARRAGCDRRPRAPERRSARGREPPAFDPGAAVRQPAERSGRGLDARRQRQHAGAQPVAVERPHGGGPGAAARPPGPPRARAGRGHRPRHGAAAGARGRGVDRGAGRLRAARATRSTWRRGSTTSPPGPGSASRGWTTGPARMPARSSTSSRPSCSISRGRRPTCRSGSRGPPASRSRRTAPTSPAWTGSTAGTWRGRSAT